MFHSFYNTPTNMIQSQYPFSLHHQPFFSSSPSPHTLRGPRLSVDTLGAQIAPGTLSPTPFKISGERWKHICPLRETGSSASQNVVSADLVGVIHLSGVRVFTCISVKAGRRSNTSDHSSVIKKGKQNLPAAYLSREMKLVSSCSTWEQAS